MTNDTKEVLLNLNLPKFVWVSEIADITNFQGNMANGIIVLDATEPTKTVEIPLLVCILGTNGFIYERNTFKKLGLSSPLLIETYNKNIQ